MDKIKLVEEFSSKIHDLHFELQIKLLGGLKGKKHDEVYRIMRLSKEGLRKYTSELYARINSIF